MAQGMSTGCLSPFVGVLSPGREEREPVYNVLQARKVHSSMRTSTLSTRVCFSIAAAHGCCKT